VDAGAAARLRAWIEGEAAAVADLAPLVSAHVVLPHGTTVGYADLTHRRRLLEFDRRGTLLSAFRWRDDALQEAWARLPDRRWLVVEPRAARDAPWGVGDRLGQADQLSGPRRPLTPFEAVDWTRIDRIPTLADPTVLPAGAGSTMLNVIASLACDHGVDRLRYAGPFPTEQLFTTLLEAFRYEEPTPDPLDAFTRGDLAWRPAPHERVITPEGACLALRGRVDKVVWRGRAFYRPDAQGVGRYAPYRVRDVGDRVVCSLWALGRALEDRLELTASGDLVRIVDAAPRGGERAPVASEITDGVGAIVAATSAPALAPVIRAAVKHLSLSWAPLDGELMAVTETTVELSSRLYAALTERLRSLPRERRPGAGLEALTELALLLGDELRARAQDAMAALPEAKQRALMEDPPEPAADTAGVIAGAVATLIAGAADNITS